MEGSVLGDARRDSTTAAPGLDARALELRGALAVRAAVVSAVAAAVGAILVATRAGTLTELDSGNLARGLERFDPAQFRPHPPGYPLVVASAHAFSWLGTPRPAYLGFAVLGSLVALAGTYLLGRELFGPRGGIVAAALLCTVPLFWYYGAIVSVYPGEEALAPFVALAAYRVARRRGPWSDYALFPVLAVAGGFRPTMLGLMLPTCLVGVALGRPPVRRLAISAAGGVAVTLAWAVPMLVASGGIGPYRRASSSLYDNAFSRTSPFAGATLAQFRFNVAEVVLASGLSLLVALLLLVGTRAWRRPPAGRWQAWAILAAWVVPYLGFYAIVHFGKPGYALGYVPGLVVAAAGLLAPARRSVALSIGAAAVVAAAYLFAPTLRLPASLENYRAAAFWPTAASISTQDDETRAFVRLEPSCPRAACSVVSLEPSHRFWEHDAWSMGPSYAPHLAILRRSDLLAAHARVRGTVLWVGSSIPGAVARHARYVGRSGTWLFYRSTPRQTDAVFADGGLT